MNTCRARSSLSPSFLKSEMLRQFCHLGSPTPRSRSAPPSAVAAARHSPCTASSGFLSLSTPEPPPLIPPRSCACLQCRVGLSARFLCVRYCVAGTIMRFLPSHFQLRSRCSTLPLFIVLFTASTVAHIHAEDWRDLSVQGYVNDFAKVLSETTVAGVDQMCVEVDQKTKSQIAVVTIKTLAGDTAENFANHLFQKWGGSVTRVQQYVILRKAYGT